ncbi:MAG: LPXTG cell wall anchor domain-containing protein [Actinomycetota bacterium]|nr:LPXTG cell wall anchor domain-containing protein [Actinomycetota bacterium]
MWSPRADRVAATLFALAATVLVAALTTVDAHAQEAGGEPASEVTAACPEPDERADPVELTSVADVEALFVGTWIRCGDGAALPPADGAVGFEVGADGRFQRVYEQADGSLVRTSGLEQEGTWSVVDLTDVAGPGAYQIDLQLLGSGVTLNRTTFFATPPSLSMVNTAGLADYVRWTGDDPVDGVAPGGGDDPCANPDDPVSPASVAEVEDLFTGTWITCGDDSAFPDAEGAVGFQARPDGRFQRVYEQADGTLVRASGLGQEGTWSVVDNTATNGPGSYRVRLEMLGGGEMSHQVTFFATPVFLRLDNLGEPVDHLRWDGEDPVDGVPPGDHPCGFPTDEVALTSVAQVRELLAGTWVHCDPASWVGGGSVGLHFEADGRWFQVRSAGDGTLVTMDGDREHGTWTVSDQTFMNGPGSYQLDLVSAANRTGMSNPVFFETPPFLRLLGSGGPYDYVPWTGEPVAVEALDTPTQPTTPTTQPTTGTTTATTAATTTTEVGTDVLGANATLPRTGTDPTTPLLVAAALAVAGALVLVSVRRPVRVRAGGRAR